MRQSVRIFAVAGAILSLAATVELSAARSAHANLSCNQGTIQGIAPKKWAITSAAEGNVPMTVGTRDGG